MKTKNKFAERGVAILFSLGILGMMTVLALTFASISMTNQTIAKNTSNQLSAKEMARSIVNRVKFILSTSGYTNGIINNPTLLQNFYSEDSTKHFDWIWKLGMTGTDIESALYRTDEVCNYSNKANLPTWQYITDSDGKIIGRFAYVVRAADLPLIDLNTAFLTDTNGNVPGNAAQYTRLGKSLNELDPNTVYEATRQQLGISSPTNFFSPASGSGYSLSGIQSALGSKRLTSYAEFDSMLPSITNKLNFSKVISNAFSPRSVKYPEIFLNASGAAVYRFDISQITRDYPSSGSDDDKETYKRNWVDQITSTGTIAAWGSDAKTTKIPWFEASASGFTDSEGGYDNAQHKAKQIAANIVDFFTPGSMPTSDVDNDKWFNTTPKYIGLKKTPYLLGFGGTLEFNVTQSYNTETEGETPTYTHNLNVTVYFTPYAELCNLYRLDTMPGVNLKLGCKGTITIRYSANGEGEAAWKNASIDINTTTLKDNTGESPDPSINTVVSFVEERAYAKRSQANAPVNFPTPTTNMYEPYTIEIKEVEFSNFRIGLHYEGHWVDLAVINHTSSDNSSSSFSWDKSFNDSELVDPKEKTKFQIDSENISGSKTMGVAFRVSDPRHNLFSSCWKGKISFDRQNYGNIIGYFNDDPPLLPMEGPSADSDRSGNPLTAQPSHAYAYIPQDAITSPWEIGAIHRGNSWQTINLKKYKDSNPTAGGSYSDGDANLLDQLRMTSDAETYGKIPLNEIQDEAKANALIQILRKNAITNDSTPNNTAGTNDFVKDNGKYKKNLSISDFFNNTKSSSPYYFSNRAELAKLLVYSSDYGYSHFVSEPSTDAAKEELFAKCVMLFDTEPTYLPRRVYVFGIAQTIQDIGVASPNTIPIYKSWNNDGSLTNTSNNSNIGKYAAGYRTGVSSGFDVGGIQSLGGTINAQLGRYDNGADKILSEQKVFAILEREYTRQPYTSSNRPVWKIVRFEYVQ